MRRTLPVVLLAAALLGVSFQAAVADGIADSGETWLRQCEARAVDQFGLARRGHMVAFTILRDETLEQNTYDAKVGLQYVAAEIVGLADIDYEAHDGRPSTRVQLPFICLHGGVNSDALYVGIVTAG